MVDTRPVSVRLPLADIAKLDRIAQHTCRTRADVVRLLVVLAAETGVPDVQLAAEVVGAHDAA
jgi:predicted DNA-binding protein